MSDRASEIIASGDTEAVLKMALGAWFAATEGRYCECIEPSLHGHDLMCGNCLLENKGQIEAANRRIREPHQWEEPREGSAARRLGWCRICTRPADDPRHIAPIPIGEEAAS